MPDEEDGPVITDDAGNDAEDSFRFRIESHVIGAAVKGVRYCGRETHEGKDRGRITISFDNGCDLEVLIEGESRVSMCFYSPCKEDPGEGRVM